MNSTSPSNLHLLLIDYSKEMRNLFIHMGSCELHELKEVETRLPETQLTDTQLIDTRQWDI